MEKKYLLKSSLVFALLMAFCIKALAQDDIPKERSYFYMENGKTKAFKASTRADDKKHFYVAFQIIGVYLFYINSYKSISYTFLHYIGCF